MTIRKTNLGVIVESEPFHHSDAGL